MEMVSIGGSSSEDDGVGDDPLSIMAARLPRNGVYNSRTDGRCALQAAVTAAFGKAVRVDGSASNSRRVVFRCGSVIETKKRLTSSGKVYVTGAKRKREDLGNACTFLAILRRRKASQTGTTSGGNDNVYVWFFEVFQNENSKRNFVPHSESCICRAKITTKLAASLLSEAVRANPKISGKAMLSQITARSMPVTVGDSMTARTLYRARHLVNTADDAYYNSYWERLERYLTDLQAMNPDCHVCLEKDTNNRFQRYFVGIKPSITLLEQCGLGFAAVDACFTKHHIVNGMQLHIIAARTSMNTIVIIGWSLELSESNDTYSWLATQAEALGFERLVRAPCAHIALRPVVFTDGFKGSYRFSENFPRLHHALCAKHLSNAIRATLRKMRRSGQQVECGFADAQVHAVCGAKSKADYTHRLRQLQRTSSHAASVLVGKSTLAFSVHAMAEAGIPCYGHCTANTAEGTNGVIEQMRHKHPYLMTDELVRYVAQRFAVHHRLVQDLQDKSQHLTAYASKAFKESFIIARRRAYQLQPQGVDTYIVYDPTSKHQVWSNCDPTSCDWSFHILFVAC